MKRFIITLLIIFSIAHARGKIYGIVYHKNIPQSGVLVQLVNLKNDVIVRSKVTSKDGKYKFNIRNGDYKLIISGDFPLVLKSYNITLNGKLLSPDVRNINPNLITISEQNKKATSVALSTSARIDPERRNKTIGKPPIPAAPLTRPEIPPKNNNRLLPPSF